MPKWLDNAVFYEIYPQSFLDTNADGICDFQGIINKLDYIRELGFNALWINPFFLSPFGDAGYDVADYYTAAPRYGTNEDLKRLFAEAHKRGIHVLLDLVPGHTSVEHKWFRESMKPEKNADSDRYIWTDSVWETPENMGCLRGISQRDGSCALNFFSCQPVLLSPHSQSRETPSSCAMVAATSSGGTPAMDRYRFMAEADTSHRSASSLIVMPFLSRAVFARATNCSLFMIPPLLK